MSIRVGSALLGPAQGGVPKPSPNAFHADGRYFLKQLANRLRLRDCTIVVRHADATHAGEVVLRSGSLLLVLCRETADAAATLFCSRVEPGVSVAPENTRRFDVARLTRAAGQKVLIDACAGILGRP